MKITIHRGTNQIGGCVTEYEHDGWRLFVDYGEQLPGAPKANKSLEIEGLTFGDLSKSALLITHYHGDHIGKLSEIAKEIPVYMGYNGWEIYRKLQRRLSYIQGDEGNHARESYERSGLIHTFMEDEEFQFGPFLIRPVKMDILLTILTDSLFHFLKIKMFQYFIQVISVLMVCMEKNFGMQYHRYLK